MLPYTLIKQDFVETLVYLEPHHDPMILSNLLKSVSFGTM
jgi:hypothetical protein